MSVSECVCFGDSRRNDDPTAPSPPICTCSLVSPIFTPPESDYPFSLPIRNLAGLPAAAAILLGEGRMVDPDWARVHDHNIDREPIEESHQIVDRLGVMNECPCVACSRERDYSPSMHRRCYCVLCTRVAAARATTAVAAAVIAVYDENDEVSSLTFIRSLVEGGEAVEEEDCDCTVCRGEKREIVWGDGGGDDDDDMACDCLGCVGEGDDAVIASAETTSPQPPKRRRRKRYAMSQLDKYEEFEDKVLFQRKRGGRDGAIKNRHSKKKMRWML